MNPNIDRQTEPRAERELTLVRVFDAPRELVFKAWTDPARMVRWWGPKHFTNPVCELDIRPGGALRIVMRAPDGAEYPMKGVFQEIVVPERLVFTNIALDREGNTLLEGLTIVRFEDQGGKTKLILETRAIAKAPGVERMLEGMKEGWSQSLERLGALVAVA